MINFKVTTGDTLETIIQKMVDLANKHNDAIKANFNGIPLFVNPGDNPNAVAEDWLSRAGTPQSPTDPGPL